MTYNQTAFHEAGHAALSYLLLPDVKIEQVTIAPRLRTLGFISYSFEDFPSNLSKEEMFNNITVLMAGRTASMKKFGAKGMDTGSSSDLEEATHQAYLAIANLGMDEELGFVHTDTLTHHVNPRFSRRWWSFRSGPGSTRPPKGPASWWRPTGSR